jgi:lactate dehydrogenase-like 2-hydroxyacid dehydrogenase
MVNIESFYKKLLTIILEVLHSFRLLSVKNTVNRQIFLQLPNLMVTPHIGGNTREAVLAMGRAAIQNLIDYFSHSK